MQRKTLLYCYLMLMLSLFCTRVLPANEPNTDTARAIVPLFNTQGMPWRSDEYYMTYLFFDEITQQTFFRTYPFTTIDTPGFYQLATNVTNQITISASNVTLDMNGCTVSGGATGITINSGLSNVTIKNGTVNNVLDGILVNAGCKDIILKNVTAKNCIRGITFDHITTGLMSHCDLVLNTTGLHIDASHDIVVEHCMASANLQAGYSLLTSTTCTFIDCKALATGDGNTSIFGATSNVFGFVSSNGRGNIFERCIANSTQELTVTTANAVVAGFAFLGTEGCSKIIECEAASATSSPNGLTIPYGIMLQAQLDSIVSVTSLNPDNGGTNDTIEILTWSPDGNFLAVGGSINGTTGNDLLVYKFNRQTQGLEQVASINPGGGGSDSVDALAWSPDGNFLAVGGLINTGAANSLSIYQFDNITGTLTLITSLNVGGGVGTVFALDWSPDGNYVVAGGTIPAITNDLFVYQFDRVAYTLTQVASVNPDSGSASDSVFGVSWSPDGRYIAIGGSIVGDTGFDVFVYAVDLSTGFHMNQIIALNPDGGSTGDQVLDVKWSPDGNYLAVARSTSSDSANNLFVYRFNKTAQTLTQIAAENPDGAGSELRGVGWSPDTNYLVVGGDAPLTLYRFDRSQEHLTKMQTVGTAGVVKVDWTLDGGYIAVGGNFSAGDDLFIYSGQQFPQNNVIMGNTVYCNSGNRYPGGIGISGSSVVNIIIGNSSYDNPQNYQFVTNVFNQLFNDEPTALQNIFINNKNPILSRYNIPAALNRLEMLANSLVDNLL